MAAAVFGGIMLGYVSYDCLHYWMHSGWVGGYLKAVHMRHHYFDPSTAYGISSPLFDCILGTMAVKGSDGGSGNVGGGKAKSVTMIE